MAAIYLILLVSAVSILGVLIHRWTSEDLISEREVRLLTEGRIAADAAYAHLGDTQQMSSVLEDLARRFGSRMLVVDTEGIVQADSLHFTQPDASFTGQSMPTDVVVDAQKQQTEQTAIYRLKHDQYALYAAVPMIRGGQVHGALLVSGSLQDITEVLSLLTHRFLWAGAAICGIFLIATWLIARSLISPLEKLRQAAVKLGTGSLDARVDVSTGDEVGEVAATFNEMAEKLQEHDRLQRRFISDASHELRSPVSSSLLLVEALETQQPESEPLLDRLTEQLQRMSRLINQLLELARLDEKAGRPNETELIEGGFPVDLESVISRVTRRLKPISESKNINIHKNVSGCPAITGSEESLERIAQNLIENALKYTPPGGQVQVEASECENQIKFAVCDSGPGIAQKDQHHIFDRFWRADESRSRHGGGFGLGLSIVRRRVQELGGQITVSSEPGKGSCFEVTFPLDNC